MSPSRSSGPARCVVVGAGLMGRWHAHEIGRTGSRLLAIVDPDTERGATLARRHRGTSVHGGLAEVELPPGDAPVVVHVCTPSGTHGPIVESVLARGWACLVEKPLADDLPATRRLIDLAHEHGCLIAPVHQFPFQRGVARLLAARDRLGEPLHLRALARSAGAEGLDATGRTNVALEILPHFVALVRRFAPSWPDGSEIRVVAPRPGELLVVGEAEDIGVELLVSMGGRPPVNRFTVVGTRATGHADLYHGYSYVERGGTSRTWKIARPLVVSATQGIRSVENLARRTARRQTAYPGLRELIGAFHDAARRRAPSPVSAEEALAAAEVIDRVRARIPDLQGA